MKNKHYNIFFTSEKDGRGKSFRFSKNTFFSIISFFLCIIFFAYVGINRVIGYDSLTNELDQLKEYKYVTSNLLIESGVREEVVNSEDLEKIIIDYIIANNIIHPSTPPIDGYVTKGIIKNGENVIHAGISVASKIKDGVTSPLDGIVIVAEHNNESGGIVILSHQNNFFTIYKNLDILLVEERNLVSKDQIIAKVGDPNEGAHLHFEIWKDNQVIDPRSLIIDYKEKDVSIR